MKKIAYLLGFVAVVSALHAVAAVGLAEHPSILVAYAASISIITAYCASILFSLYGVKPRESALEPLRRKIKGLVEIAHEEGFTEEEHPNVFKFLREKENAL